MLFTRQQQQNALKYCATSVEPTFPFVQRFLFVRKSLKAKGMSTSDVNAQQQQLQQRGTRRLAAGSLLMVQWPPFFFVLLFSSRFNYAHIFLYTSIAQCSDVPRSHLLESIDVDDIRIGTFASFPLRTFLEASQNSPFRKKRNVFKKRNCKFRRRKKKGARGRPVSQYLYK